MKKYKAVIFDFDYTLVDATPGIVGSFEYALSVLNFRMPPVETIKKTVGMSMPEALAQLTGSTDFVVIEVLRRHFRNKADEIMTENTSFYPESLRILEKLKDKGIKTGIVTSKNRYRIEEAFDKFNVPAVDFVVGFEDVKNPKPSPDGLNDIISLLKVKKDDVLYVGDSLIDAKTARAAKVDFAGVLTGTATKEELLRYPNIAVFNNLDELANDLLL